MSVHHFYEQLLTLIFAVGLTFAGVFILLRVILKLNSGKQGLNYIPDGSALILSLVRTILVSSAGLFLLLLFVQALKDATINNSSLTAQSLKNADSAFDKSNGFEDLAAISSAIAIIAISLIIGVIIASIITSIFRIIRDSILYFVYYDKNYLSTS
jgi:flagellar biosynthesis protein FlhB